MGKRRPLKTCPAPGCHKLTAEMYCPVHEAEWQQKRQTRLKQTRQRRFRSTGQWQRFRKWFKAQHPLCYDPLVMHPKQAVPTEHVHHITAVAQQPELACDENNTAPLCARCHQRVEDLERRGQPTAYLFSRFQATVER